MLQANLQSVHVEKIALELDVLVAALAAPKNWEEPRFSHISQSINT
jgi:hypothetical protein